MLFCSRAKNSAETIAQNIFSEEAFSISDGTFVRDFSPSVRWCHSDFATTPASPQNCDRNFGRGVLIPENEV